MSCCLLRGPMRRGRWAMTVAMPQGPPISKTMSPRLDITWGYPERAVPIKRPFHTRTVSTAVGCVRYTIVVSPWPRGGPGDGIS